MFKKLLLTAFLTFLLNSSAQAVTKFSDVDLYNYSNSATIKIKGTNKILHAYLQNPTGHGNNVLDKIVGQIATCASATDCSTVTVGPSFDIYNDPIFRESVVTMWQCTDSGCPFPNRIYVYPKRLSNQTDAKDWGYVYSDDNGETWSDYSIQIDLSADSAYTRWQINGSPAKTQTPGKYIWAMSGRNEAETLGKISLFVTTDYGVTWTKDATELYSDTTLWAEPITHYLGNNTIIVFARTGGNNKWAMWRSIDGGDSWSSLIQTDIGGTAVNVTGGYTDEAYDNLVLMNFDRSSGGKSQYRVVPNSLARRLTTAWGTFTNIQTGFTDNGQHSAARVDDNHIIIFWSNELSSSRADIVYEIIENGTDNQHLKFN